MHLKKERGYFELHIWWNILLCKWFMGSFVLKVSDILQAHSNHEIYYIIIINSLDANQMMKVRTSD